MSTVSVVGAGKVGSTVAQLCAQKGWDVILVNRTVGKAKGIALDISESLPLQGSDAQVVGTGSYGPTKGSDVVVITAGIQRKEGMSREELLATNAKIVKDAARKLAEASPKAVMIVVSNPLDAMVTVAWKASRFPSKRVVGMAGILDSSRYRSFIARATGVSVKDVEGMVLGGHGDAMLPLVRFTTVSGIPLQELLHQNMIKKIVSRTIHAGAEIIKLEKSSAYYAPAASVVEMVEAILLDQKRVLPCSTLLNGQFGIRGTFLGVPVVLGKSGVERVVEFPLTAREKAHLKRSAQKVKALVRLT